MKSKEEWQKLLTPEAFDILRKSGTERPFSSTLNKEYGMVSMSVQVVIYHCLNQVQNLIEAQVGQVFFSRFKAMQKPNVILK